VNTLEHKSNGSKGLKLEALDPLISKYLYAFTLSLAATANAIATAPDPPAKIKQPLIVFWYPSIFGWLTALFQPDSSFNCLVTASLLSSSAQREGSDG
jgi:hypothetical protein